MECDCGSVGFLFSVVSDFFTPKLSLLIFTIIFTFDKILHIIYHT